MKIQITAKRPEEYHDLEIDFEQIYRIVVEALLNVYDLRSDYYLADGNVVYDEELYTSHSWTETRIVRKATPKDVEGLGALARLNEWYRILRKEKRGNDVS